MNIASEMCNGGPLAEGFCCFDGKLKRTRNFKSLTAITYHPFLRKQITLATMECKGEDSRHVAQFWKLFNNWYKEANETENKFEPRSFKSVTSIFLKFWQINVWLLKQEKRIMQLLMIFQNSFWSSRISKLGYHGGTEDDILSSVRSSQETPHGQIWPRRSSQGRKIGVRLV